MATFITKEAKQKSLKIVDAKSNLVLVLEAGDIKKGTLKSPGTCAFACAAKRQMPGVQNAYFFRSTAWIETTKKMIRYILPGSMQKEIVAFDRGGSMDPGTYTLVKPQKSHTLGRVRQRNAKRTGRHETGAGTIKRKVVFHSTGNIRTLQVK